MKSTVCSFLLSLFIVTLIASCDSSTGPDNAQGQRIGTFMVYADKANWVGVQGSAKAKTNATTQAQGDTISLNNPDGKNLFLVDKGDVIRFILQDSTYGYDKSGDISARLYNPLTPNMNYGVGPRPEYLQFYGNVPVHCDSTYGGNEDVIITYHKETDIRPRPDSMFIKAFRLNTAGIVSAAKHIRCN